MPRSRQKNCEELHQDEISPKDKGTLWMKYKEGYIVDGANDWDL